MKDTSPLRVGIGGPVGSGKTALTLALCKALRDKYDIAAVTNDIYTEEDAQFLVTNEALAPERIIGVETGGCPHTAIREDASINLEAVARLNKRSVRASKPSTAVPPEVLSARLRNRAATRFTATFTTICSTMRWRPAR